MTLLVLHRRAGLGAIAMVAACGASIPAPTPLRARLDPDALAAAKLAREGFDRFAAKDAAGAADRFERALASSPGDDQLLYLAALTRAYAGDTSEALRELVQLADMGSDLVPTGHAFAKLETDPSYLTVRARLARNAARFRSGTEAFRVDAPRLLAEGIAFDASASAFYLGSIRRKKIVELREGHEPRDLVTSLPHAPLGLRVDVARRLLWVATEADADQDGFTDAEAGRAALVVIDLTRRAIAATYAMPRNAEHLLNDVALDARGRPFVTDSAAGTVVTLGSDGHLEPLFPSGRFSYPNGIAFDSPGALFVADSVGVWRVDVATRCARLITHPPAIALGDFDGLYLDGDRLVGIQGTASARVVALTMNTEHDAVLERRVLESDHPAFDGPTTGAMAAGKLFVVANGRTERETIVLAVPVR